MPDIRDIERLPSSHLTGWLAYFAVKAEERKADDARSRRAAGKRNRRKR